MGGTWGGFGFQLLDDQGRDARRRRRPVALLVVLGQLRRYQNQGLCDDRAAGGRRRADARRLLQPDAARASRRTPLRLSGVPADRRAGRGRHAQGRASTSTDVDPASRHHDDVRSRRPARRVAARRQTATTGADGTATADADDGRTGDDRRHEGRPGAHRGRDVRDDRQATAAAAAQLPPGTPLGTEKPATTRPRRSPSLTGLKNGARCSRRKRAPRDAARHASAPTRRASSRCG